MKIMKLFEAKRKKLADGKIPTIVFFGDSITQGCFEFYMKNEKSLQTVFDRENSICNGVSKIFELLFPTVPVNIVNAGISGSSAVDSVKRVERDVLSFSPDLTVVSFGLNDSFMGEEGIGKYCDALKSIFEKIKESGSEVIFMTQNMMNTEISCHLKDDYLKNLASITEKLQNDGVVEKYFEAAKKAAEECEVRVCDIYSKWKRMEKCGVDTNILLANHINHPKREMNKLSAYSLVEIMMED